MITKAEKEFDHRDEMRDEDFDFFNREKNEVKVSKNGHVATYVSSAKRGFMESYASRGRNYDD